MASVTSGYHQLPNGYWIKDSDNTGPFVHVTPGVFTAAMGGSSFPAGSFGALNLIGANLWGVNDYKKDYPYADYVQSSRGFKPIADPFGATDVTLKGDGWPSADFVSVLISNQVASDAGVYTISFTGTASSITNASGTAATISSISYNAGTNKSTATATYDASGILALAFNGISADFADYRCYGPGYGVGAGTYRSEFLAALSAASTFRGMDWLNTNSVTSTTWTGSPIADSTSRYKYRDTLQACLDFCNATGKHCWVNIPHTFDDAGIGTFVSTAHSGLAAGKTLTIEWSNEPWNSLFGVFNHAMTATKTAAGMFTGNASTGVNRIISVVRASNVVTVTLAADHGLTTGASVYLAGVTNITSGQNTCTVTGARTLTFAQVAADTTGTVATGNDNSYLHTNLTHRYVAAGSFGVVQPVSPYVAKLRYQVDKCRVIYNAIVSAGATARARVVMGCQLSDLSIGDALGYAQDQYGTSSWLILSPAYYAFPATPASMTTMAAVFSQLETARAALKTSVNKAANTLLSWGCPLYAYEGGPHTDSKPNGTVASAVNSAHLDDQMRVFVKNMITDWRDYGAGGLFNYYTFGATDTFGTTTNNTWPLVSGGISNTTQPKYVAIQETMSASATPVSITSVTWGTIPLTTAWQYTFPNGDANGNKVLSSTYKLGNNRLSVLVVPPAAGTYTLAVNACSASGASDWITIEVNGSVIALQQPCSTGNPFSVPAPEMYSGSVSLTAGANVITLVVKPTPRAGNYGLRSLVLT